MLAKVIHRHGHYALGCGELLDIIEGYSASSSLSDRIVVESDSLDAINNLGRNTPNIFALGTLVYDFSIAYIGPPFKFSHVYRTENCRPIF